MQRRAVGKSPIHENSLPMPSGLTIKSAKEVCVGIRPGLMEGRVSCLTSLPCDPPPAQTTTERRRKQLRTRHCEFNKLWYWDYILLPEHICLASQKRSYECNEVFCLTHYHPRHLPLSISSLYLQETQNQIYVLNGMKQLGNILQQRNPDIKLGTLCLLSHGGKMVTKQQNTF